MRLLARHVATVILFPVTDIGGADCDCACGLYCFCLILVMLLLATVCTCVTFPSPNVLGGLHQFIRVVQVVVST